MVRGSGIGPLAVSEHSPLPCQDKIMSTGGEEA